MAGTPAATSSPSASKVIEKVDGIFEGFPGDCPDDLPATPLVCHEWDITVFRSGGTFTDGGVAPPHTPWVLIALRHTLTFPGGDVDPVESDVAQGFVVGADVTFDRQHLSYASVRAPDLQMSDGTVVDLEATWTATTDRMLWGNDGPALADFGRVRHLHTDCLNMVSQGHQKVRGASVQAIIDGVESRYDGRYAFMSFNQFITIEVHPRSCS
jgi:hypothetical protein